jgi:hypothetical protein
MGIVPFNSFLIKFVTGEIAPPNRRKLVQSQHFGKVLAFYSDGISRNLVDSAAVSSADYTCLNLYEEATYRSIIRLICMSPKSTVPKPELSVERRIHLIRSQRVVLDRDLADLYGVTTYRLNEQVKRNRQRFPEDFMFSLTNQEVTNLRSQFAISSWGGRRTAPNAFTEHGAVMAATILNSEVAVQMSILIVRAFIRLREMMREHADLKRRLQDIETRVAKGFSEHEQELQELRFLISRLEEPSPIKKGKLGF